MLSALNYTFALWKNRYGVGGGVQVVGVEVVGVEVVGGAGGGG